jgi:hypothetical protein
MNHAWQISKADLNNTQMTRDIQRDTLAEHALAMGAEYMMCFDDDTVPPSHEIQSLYYILAQNPKAAIAGGIYCTKGENPEPTIYKELGGGSHWNWTLGDIFKVKGIGAGCMMVRLSALKDIPKPWFKDTAGEPTHTERVGDLDLKVISTTGTDDLYFCRKVDEAGYDIIAHGGVLCLHYDEEGRAYHLPDDSYPVQSYLEKKAKFLKEGRDDASNLKAQKIS